MKRSGKKEETKLNIYYCIRKEGFSPLQKCAIPVILSLDVLLISTCF